MTAPGKLGMVKPIGASTAPFTKSSMLSRSAGVANKPATSTRAVELKYTPPDAKIQTLPLERSVPLINAATPPEQMTPDGQDPTRLTAIARPASSKINSTVLVAAMSNESQLITTRRADELTVKV